MAETTYTPTYKQKYLNEVRPHLIKKFDLKSMMEAPKIEKITLNIGLGTFKPIQVNRIEDHLIHKERISVDSVAVETIMKAKNEGRRVIAIGTTVLRCLESVASDFQVIEPYEGETDLFVYPGYQFKIVDALLTNFHLPKSSLFLLVSAFGGSRRIMSAYLHAIRNEYRFFSYGDSMFITNDE